MPTKKAAHTPGPWGIWNDYKDGKTAIQIRDIAPSDPVNGRTIASVKQPNAQANARLIAAAPDYYALLREVLGDLESGFIAQDSHRGEVNRRKLEKKIRTAIEKATGGR